MQTEIVIFGGGCFWCTEAVFKMLRGVVSATSGYARNENVADAGHAPASATRAPTYAEVSTGSTGFAEVIYIKYEPSKISLQNLLTVFFASHDPTTKNRQGADIGNQYRSIILYTNDAQKVTTENFIKELNASSTLGAPIVTEIAPLTQFYPAENYHQNYYAQNSQNQYCEIVINPKLKKVQEKFVELLKENENF